MDLLEHKTVAEVVAENIKTAHIFKKHGIDFCCGGGITIEKACGKKQLNYDVVKTELLQVDKVSKAYDYNSWELDFLIEHIINIHHSYVEEAIPLILHYSKRVAKVHGHHYTEVITINKLFSDVAKELADHLMKEELVLFPYIKKLLQQKKDGSRPFNKPPFKTVDNPIQTMEDEHELAGDIFKTIAQLTNNYTPPDNACNTFRALYAKLEEFEKDLHCHIHLENNILHPKAKQLEQEVLNS